MASGDGLASVTHSHSMVHHNMRRRPLNHSGDLEGHDISGAGRRCAVQSERLPLGKHPVDDMDQSARHRHPRYLGTVPCGNPVVELAEARALVDQLPPALDQHPAQPARALLGDVPEPGVAARGVDRRHQPGIGRQVAGRRETADVADLSQDQQRRVRPDTGDGQQQLRPLVLLRQQVDAMLHPLGFGNEVLAEAQQAVDLHPVAVAQLCRRQEPTAARTEDVLVRAVQAVLGQHRTQPAAHLRRHHDQRRPVTQHLPQVPGRHVRDVRLGQQVAAQEVGQRVGADLSVMMRAEAMARVFSGWQSATWAPVASTAS